MASTTFIDIHGHPGAVPFYHTFPSEPIPPEGANGTVTVGDIVAIEHMPLAKLLQGILKKVKKNGSILIVCHGNDAGLFSLIGHAKKETSMLMADALDVIRDNQKGGTSDQDAAEQLYLELKAFQDLKAQIQKMQQLELDRVDIRACSTGNNTGTMEKLQQFFNCNTVCAPTIYDSFGAISINKTSSNSVVWTEWFKKHQGATMEGVPPDRIALKYRISMSPPRVDFDCLADSEQAAKNWIARHIGSGGRGSTMLYHALLDNLALKLIFVLDPGFRGLLAEVARGQVKPRPKIDMNQVQPIQ